MDFMKPHQSAMKKWLSLNSEINVKSQIEKKINQAVDLEKLLEYMRVKSAEQGLLKIYSMLQILDLMATKYSEYEILFFMRYEETFNQLTKNYATMNNKINIL